MQGRDVTRRSERRSSMFFIFGKPLPWLTKVYIKWTETHWKNPLVQSVCNFLFALQQTDPPSCICMCMPINYWGVSNAISHLNESFKLHRLLQANCRRPRSGWRKCKRKSLSNFRRSSPRYSFSSAAPKSTQTLSRTSRTLSVPWRIWQMCTPCDVLSNSAVCSATCPSAADWPRGSWQCRAGNFLGHYWGG